MEKEGVQRTIATRTKWTLWITIIILALILGLYVKSADISFSPVTGQQGLGGGIAPGGGSSGASAGPGNGDSGGGGKSGGTESTGDSGASTEPKSGGGAVSPFDAKKPIESLPNPPECADKEDNDGDGWIDFGEDPSCGSVGDDDESDHNTEKACSDAIDNDNDELRDGNDPGCRSPDDGNEETECQDGIDNDGDVAIDKQDPGCWDDIFNPRTYNPHRNKEEAATPQCGDGIDNLDQDGFCDAPGNICRDGSQNPDPNCDSIIDNDELGGGGPQSDKDGDGVQDDKDNCPEKSNPDQSDKDNDGVGDVCDNCIEIPNPNQEDTNSNGIGDACDSEDRGEEGDRGKIKECGNAIIEEGEECDDGNIQSNDGCSASCTLEELPEEQRARYEIKEGKELFEGEFATIVLTINDQVIFLTNGIIYTISIIDLDNEKVEILLSSDSLEISRIINLETLEKIELLDDKVLAIKTSSILQEDFVEFTIALLGPSVISDEETKEEFEQVFESITSEEGTGQRVDTRRIIEKAGEKPEIPLLLRTIVGLLAIIILIVYIISKNLSSAKRRRY